MQSGKGGKDLRAAETGKPERVHLSQGKAAGSKPDRFAAFSRRSVSGPVAWVLALRRTPATGFALRGLSQR